MGAASEAAELILSGSIRNGRELHEMKKGMSEKFGVPILKNSEILSAIPREKRSGRVIELLRTCSTRSISGVSVIAVMAKPAKCPGRCIYCPRGENAPQSYTGREPAALRGIQNEFDAYRQVVSRIEQLRETGHVVEKSELIVMGGTFNSLPKNYQRNFIKACLDAMNGRKARSLEDAEKANEGAAVRAVGITFETRPDWCKKKDVDWLLKLGATRIELGVQTLSNKVYKRVHRGHCIEDVAIATRVCKDSALKVCYHIMPGLFAGKKEDVGMFRKLFVDARFKPDMLKLYPCLVLEGTGLHEMWRRGEYTPYSTEQAADVIAAATKYIPRYVRIMRVQRDIPAALIAAGVRKSNLRQLIDEKLAEKGIGCECIRCREIGHKMLKQGFEPDAEAIGMGRIGYAASGGKEIFLSFDEAAHDALVGFLRLRKPFKPHRKELAHSALVRELHVYGEELPISVRAKVAKEVQHRGFGRKLLLEAERIAKEEWGAEKIAVMSGIGARRYYEKFGYARDGPYMSKSF